MRGTRHFTRWLYTASEVFLTGTATIKPVAEIDCNRMVGDGRTGKRTKQLRLLLNATVHGKDRKFSKKWLTLIN